MIRKYPKGQILIFEGDPVTHLYKLIYGAVKVYAINGTGEEHVLTIRSAPDIFPLSLLIGRPNSEFFYETATDCQIELIKPDDLEIYERSEAYEKGIQLFYESLHRVAALEEKTVAERASATLDFIEKHGLTPTHQLIADMSNATRESITQSIKKNPKMKRKINNHKEKK